MSALLYFFMTSCNSVMVLGGFLASLEEHHPRLTLLTAARITYSSVMSRVGSGSKLNEPSLEVLKGFSFGLNVGEQFHGVIGRGVDTFEVVA